MSRTRNQRRQDRQARALMLAALITLVAILALTVHATAVICGIPAGEQIMQALTSSDISR